VVGAGGVPAFTRDGIEYLQKIIADKRAAGRAPPQVKPAEQPRLRSGSSVAGVAQTHSTS
jgi:hypothetical protein